MTKEKTGSRRMLGITLFLLLFVILSGLVSAADKEKSIRIGCALTTGYHQKNEAGKVTGFGYSYEALLKQFAGWNVEYVEGTWPQLQQKLADGEIDLLGFLVKNSAREKTYDYSKLSVGHSMSCLVTKKENGKYTYQDYASFDGMQVACVKSNANVDAFTSYTKEKHFKVQIEYYDTYSEVFDAIDRGVADAGLVTNYQKLSDYSVVDQFLPVDYYYCVKKGDTQLLAQLDAAMGAIDSYYTDIESTIYNQYYDQTNGKNAAFTQEELAYLSTNPVVQIVPCGRKVPFEGYDEKTDTYSGIVPDILEKLTDITGISFQYIETEDRWLYRKQDLGENVMTCFSVDSDWMDGKGLNITQPFLESTVSVIQKEIPQGKVTVAVPKGNYLDFLAQKTHPEWKEKNYDTKEECLEAVKKGEVACTLLNSYEADYYMSMGRYRSLKEEALGGVVQNIGFGITKSSNEHLFSIISKAMLMIPTDEYDAIIRTNANRTAEGTFLDEIYENPARFTGIALLVGLLIITSIGMMLYVAAVKKKNREVVEANSAKTDFLSRISHDLRTPMNAIINLTNIVEEEIDDKQSALEDIGKIKTSNQFLLSLINDVLDVTKMEEKKMELHPERYRYKDFLDYIHSTFEPLCQEKNITLLIQKGDEDSDILIDKVRFNQLCFNLLSNAVKYTPEGGRVQFRMKHGKIEDGMFPCDIYVEDSGIGMNPEFIKEMYEPFSQEGRAFRSVEGTGLGLYIVKQIVELLHGTIEADSQVGMGTTVHVHFVMQAMEDIKAPQEVTDEKPLNLAGKKILVVEDHPLNAEIITRLLEKAGCMVTHVTDGGQGLEKFRETNPGTYDGILMDVRMPVMNGIEATKAIRSLDRMDAAQIPIVAITANAYEEDVRECMRAGMNAHVSKPIQPAVLYQTLRELL